MRKQMVDEFNETTKYNVTKRHKDQSYLIQCLDKYVKTIFSEQILNKEINSNDLIYTLGSLFYPKDMRRIHASDKSKLRTIDQLHHMLARFSGKTMKNSLENNSACRFLLKHFIENFS